MNYEDIKYLAFLLYKKCDIKSFPFDCELMLDNLGVDCIKYSSLSKEKQNACYKLSDSAFLLDFNIYYNDNEIYERVKFSLMHELGHIIMGHKKHTPANEREANFFAKNILVPPMAMHYTRTQEIKDIATIFNITPTFASNALKYYNKWLNITTKYGMSKLDKEFYRHFYTEEYQGFVFKKHYCAFCEKPIYNTIEPICKSCEISFMKRKNTRSDETVHLRNNWLYGGI